MLVGWWGSVGDLGLYMSVNDMYIFQFVFNSMEEENLFVSINSKSLLSLLMHIDIISE